MDSISRSDIGGGRSMCASVSVNSTVDTTTKSFQSISAKRAAKRKGDGIGKEARGEDEN